MDNHIIIINSGSSSVKIAIYEEKELNEVYNVLMEDLQGNPGIKIKNSFMPL